MFRMLGNIFQNLLHAPATRRYPTAPRQLMTGSRGRLEIDPAVCIYCGLCAGRCPAGAITVTRKPNPKSWTLDPYRCIVCGYCVEACPKKCLTMNPRHGIAECTRQP
jgi:ech hydrogenase subunit F